MASVVVTQTACRSLETLIETHSLPASTVDRVRRALEPLRQLPSFGAPLEGRWSGFRFILGPWRWTIILHWCTRPPIRSPS